MARVQERQLGMFSIDKDSFDGKKGNWEQMSAVIFVITANGPLFWKPGG